MLGGPILPAVLSIAKCTHELEQGQGQEQDYLLAVKLSDATSPEVHVEPLDGHLQIDVDAHAEMARQVTEEIQAPS